MGKFVSSKQLNNRNPLESPTRAIFHMVVSEIMGETNRNGKEQNEKIRCGGRSPKICVSIAQEG